MVTYDSDIMPLHDESWHDRTGCGKMKCDTMWYDMGSHDTTITGHNIQRILCDTPHTKGGSETDDPGGYHSQDALCLCVYMSRYVSISLGPYLPVSLFLYLSISLSLYLSIPPSLYLAVSLYLSTSLRNVHAVTDDNNEQQSTHSTGQQTT